MRITADAGPADVLVNNAASVGRIGTTADLIRASWLAGVALNLLAAVGRTSAVLQGMRERCWGRVVDVSAGVTSETDWFPGANIYGATKVALEAHAKNLAHELVDTGLTENLFRPACWTPRCRNGSVEPSPRPPWRARLRCEQARAAGELRSPGEAAGRLVARLRGEGTGETWLIGD